MILWKIFYLLKPLTKKWPSRKFTKAQILKADKKIWFCKSCFRLGYSKATNKRDFYSAIKTYKVYRIAFDSDGKPYRVLYIFLNLSTDMTHSKNSNLQT